MTERVPITGLEFRMVGLLAVALVLPLYMATATWSSLQSDDPRSAALAGWQVAKTGGLAMDEGWTLRAIAWPAEGADGRVYSNRFPGVIALAVVGYSGAAAVGALPPGQVDNPFDVPLWPATLVAVLVALVAALLTWRLFRETSVSPNVALIGAGVVALGSPLWSVSASALWTHGATHALLVGVVLALLKRRFGLAAVLGGMAGTLRPHLVVPILVLAVFQKGWRQKITLGAGGAAGVLLVAAYSFWIFGQPLPAAGYRVGGLINNMPLGSVHAFAGNVAAWLFDPLRGVLTFVPILLIAVWKMRAAWKQSPDWVRVAALAGLSYAFVQLGLIRASGGDFFFGHRTTIEALVLASPLLVVTIQEWARTMGAPRRIALQVAIGISVVIHAYGAVVDIPPRIKESLRESHERRVEAVLPGQRI